MAMVLLAWVPAHRQHTYVRRRAWAEVVAAMAWRWPRRPGGVRAHDAGRKIMGHRCYMRRSSIVGLRSSVVVHTRRAGDGGCGHCSCYGRENGSGKRGERKSKQRLDNTARRE